jgi:hypothetical protein
MNEEESLKNEREILSHFENLKAALLKALRMGAFQNFDETSQIKVSITVFRNTLKKVLLELNLTNRPYFHPTITIV